MLSRRNGCERLKENLSKEIQSQDLKQSYIFLLNPFSVRVIHSIMTIYCLDLPVIKKSSKDFRVLFSHSNPKKSLEISLLSIYIRHERRRNKKCNAITRDMRLTRHTKR